MIKDIIILGSTGSIGQSTLNVIAKDKLKFRIKLLTTNRNIKKIYNQAIDFNVKKVVINDKKKFKRFVDIFKKKKLKFFLP